MGMTINESIEIISDIDKAYRTFSDIEYRALQKSIETMRKYQKIEQILDDCDLEAWEVLEKIRKVAENGSY